MIISCHEIMRLPTVRQHYTGVDPKHNIVAARGSLTINLARIWAVLAPGGVPMDAARPQDSFGPSFSSSGATATHFTPKSWPTQSSVCNRFQLGSSREVGNLPSDFQDCFRTAQRVLGLASIWFLLLLRAEPGRRVS